MYSIEATLMILGMVSTINWAESGSRGARGIFVESEWSIDFNYRRVSIEAKSVHKITSACR